MEREVLGSCRAEGLAVKRGIDRRDDQMACYEDIA
jgi:hypothetical protein